MNKFKFLFLLNLMLIVIMVTSAISQVEIRVNCGGTEYRDRYGNLWQRDQHYRSGSWGYENEGYFLEYSYNISGTQDDQLYQQEHNALDTYRFDVPNGKYIVELKFAECYYRKVGDRVFHVVLEGKRVMKDFDMFATAGFATAIDRTFEVEVNDGRLDMKFQTIYPDPDDPEFSLAHANVKAIAVIEQGTEEPKLWLSKDELNFRTSSSRQTFTITNGGSEPLEWQCAENPDESWITSIVPVSGTLHQDQSQQVYVYVTRSGLEEGSYNGKIAVTSNGGDSDIDVKMEVDPATPIANTDVSVLDFGSLLTQRQFVLENSGTARLNWSVRNSDPDAWITNISPSSGKLEIDEKQVIIVQIDRTLEISGDSSLSALLNVNSDGGNLKVELKADIANNPARINCGGEEFSDVSGNIWLDDLSYSGGEAITFTSLIENTENDLLYQTARAGESGYQIHVQENGLYNLNLHFAETEVAAAGERVFQVICEDSVIIDSLDIFTEIGGASALTRQVKLDITDNIIDLNLVSLAGEPVISGIELLKVPVVPYLYIDPVVLDFGDSLTTMAFMIQNMGINPLNWSIDSSTIVNTPFTLSSISGITENSEVDTVVVTFNPTELSDGLYTCSILVESDGGSQEVMCSARIGSQEPYLQRVNAGGHYFVDSNDLEWADDQEYTPGSWGYVGGDIYRKDLHILNTVDDKLYQSERYGMDAYIFDVPNGNYEVTLLIAEIYWSGDGKRIFNVSIEGEPVYTDLDIYAEAGRRNPMIQTFQVQVKDGQINIEFSETKDKAKISAIEVKSVFEQKPVAIMSTSIEPIESAQLPESMALLQNYPNPFNMETIIGYQLSEESDVKLEIFNMLGQKQKTLVAGAKTAGQHKISWNGLDESALPVASGVYVYRITAIPKSANGQPFFKVRKMILVK